MEYAESALIFQDFDSLAQAKLLTIFALHAFALGLLVLLARAQPDSTLARFRLISGNSLIWPLFVLVVASVIAGANIAIGRTSGAHTVVILNACILSLYVIEYAILLSKGFFKRLLGDELPPEMLLFVCFVLMVNAGYFALMFLKDVILTTEFGI